MAQFVNMFQVDLQKPTAPQPLRRVVGEGDAKGLRVGAVVTDGGSVISLGGTCVGKVVRADGATVTLTGTISGNTAYVVLDQASCAIEGPISVAVCWVSGSNVTTLVVAYGTVVNTQTGNAIQPGTPIPDLAQLLAAIDDMETATAAANAAAAGAISNFAPAFAEATANGAGSYVTYSDGKLYYLPYGHTGNATWANTQKSLVTVGGDAQYTLALRSERAVQLVSGTNFNSITTPGNYRVATYADAQTMTNIPEVMGGRLTVMTVSGSTICQIYISNVNRIYWRTYESSAWRRWESSNAPRLALDYGNAATIPDNRNLNSYTTAGNYIVASVASAETISNMPAALGGRLTVMTLVGSSSVHQWYIDSTGGWHSREYVGGTWSAWLHHLQKISTTYEGISTIPGSADLNSYTTAGNYKVNSSTVAKSIANMPVALGGRLTILTLAGSGSVHQWYIDTSGEWHAREYVGGEWAAWKHFAYVEAATDPLSGKSAYNVIHVLALQANYDMAFANAFVPLPMLNYVGDTQNVHPKVLYFSSGFGGHKYWMAYTPYPYSNDLYENPCVAYSDDGIKWTNIDSNPLDNPQGTGYDSDTHLVYNSDTGKLECWYRWVAPSGTSPRHEIIYRQTSSDGSTWGAKEAVFDNDTGDYANLLSPAVIIDNSKYCMWVVQGTHSPVTIDYYEAPVSDVTSWTKVRSISLSFSDGGTAVNPWHLDAIKDGSTYILLVQCRNSQDVATAKCSLFIATSSDNITYTTPTKVVGGADSWDRYMYRSSIVKIGSKYRIYYSAGSGGTTTIYNKAVWGIGITESSSLSNFYGLYE